MLEATGLCIRAIMRVAGISDAPLKAWGLELREGLGSYILKT